MINKILLSKKQKATIIDSCFNFINHMVKQRGNLMSVPLQIIVVQIFLYLFIAIVQLMLVKKEQKRLFIVQVVKRNY